jgi:hypothetical protein
MVQRSSGAVVRTVLVLAAVPLVPLLITGTSHRFPGRRVTVEATLNL